MTPDPSTLPSRMRDASRRAVERWGWEAQTRMVLEETAELQVAILHRMRQRVPIGAVVEELADVYLVLQGLRWAEDVSEEEVAAAIERKLQRLEERLAEGGEIRAD